jgi:hypothetical protein
MDAAEIEEVRKRVQEVRSDLGAAGLFDWEDIILQGGTYDGLYVPDVEVGY